METLTDSVTVSRETVFVRGERWAVLWREHRPFLWVIGVSTLLVVGLDLSGAVPGMAAPFWDWPSAVALLPLIPLLSVGLVAWTGLRGQLPWGSAWAEARSGPLATDRLLALALVIVATRFLILNAVAWKASIPTLHPFVFDVPLAQLDSMLHGGDPWRLIPVAPWWLRSLDAFYLSWFLAFLAVELWWGWQPPSPKRRRFLLALALVWIIGSMFGVLVSSAGPVYYQLVTGGTRYAAQVTLLAKQPLAAVELQARLWDTYANGGATVVKGIAAFPSIHVAMPALYALATRGRWRYFWWGFTALTLVGSVALGWHYAVDGYAGILIAWLMWRVAGWVT